MESLEGRLPAQARQRLTSQLGGLMIHSYSMQKNKHLTLHGVALSATGYLLIEARTYDPQQLELARELLHSIRWIAEGR